MDRQIGTVRRGKALVADRLPRIAGGVVVPAARVPQQVRLRQLAIGQIIGERAQVAVRVGPGHHVARRVVAPDRDAARGIGVVRASPVPADKAARRVPAAKLPKRPDATEPD